MIKDIQNLTDNSEYLSLYPARILVVQTLYSIDILNKKKDIAQISSDYIEYHVEKYSNQNLDEKIGKFTRRQHLQLALIKSNNRSADILCENYPGGTDACVAAMNFKAKKLRNFNRFR